MIFCELVIWFFVYSIFGWCYETTYCSIEAGEFVKRGFFYGPFLPIYGFGAIIIVLLLHKQMNNVALFFYSLILTTALEYATSWILEVIFKKTWWDYSDYTLQLNGRICLLASLLFGFLGVLLVNKLHPKLKQLTDRIKPRLKVGIASTLVVLGSIDLVFSVIHNAKY